MEKIKVKDIVSMVVYFGGKKFSFKGFRFVYFSKLFFIRGVYVL